MQSKDSEDAGYLDLSDSSTGQAWMKILLIRPPAKFAPGTIPPLVSLPLGLLYIAAVLQRGGHSVSICDAQVNLDQPVTKAPDGTMHMGWSWEAVGNEIAERRPDIVGVSCMFSAQFPNSFKTAEIVKAVDSRILTVVGGSHPTMVPRDFFPAGSPVDMTCLGEGEQVMTEIADALRQGASLDGIAGTAFLKEGELRVNPPRPLLRDLDELPLPAYHLINLEHYFEMNARGFFGRPVRPRSGCERAASMVTSRGCPFNCIFCSIHLLMGRPWREHSAPYVLAHVEHLVKAHGIKHIHFEDDNLSFDPVRFRDIITGLKRIDPDLTWDTPNGVRVDTLSRELLVECKRSGCSYLVFGVESGNQQVLDRIVEKRLDLGTVVKAASWCHEIGLDAMAFYVVGFPGESVAAMQDTVNFALDLQKKYGVLPGLFVATPLPGTRLEKVFLERGLLEAPLSADQLARMTQGDVVLGGDTFTEAELRGVLRRFRRGYRWIFVRNTLLFLFLNPGAVVRLTRRVFLLKGAMPVKRTVLNALRFPSDLKKTT